MWKFTLVFVAFFLKLNAWSLKENDLYEGDIELTTEQRTNVRMNGYASIRGTASLWPQATVPYVIDPRFERKWVLKIKESMEDYHRYTCIKFVPRQLHHKSYLNIKEGFGCSSGLGFTGGEQKIRLMTPACMEKGIIMHEIGHSLGLYHEHSRPDRDRFVYIDWFKIKGYAKNNFEKRSTNEVDSRGTRFDYLSMMMYGQNAFSRNAGDVTIMTRDPTYQKLIGQRKGFSKIDVIQLNKMYPCYKTVSPPDPVTITPIKGLVTTPPTTTQEKFVCREESQSKCRQLKNNCRVAQIQKMCPITCKIC